MNVTAADYQARIAAGKCPRCGCYLSTGWMRRNCGKCLREIAEHSRKHYWRKRGQVAGPKREAPIRNAEFYRARYQERKASGYCPRCPNKIPKGSEFTLCATCRNGAKESREENLPRCRCGLLLPCNSCVPSIYAFASIRRGSQTEGG